MSFTFLQEQGEASSADSFSAMFQSAPLSWRNTLEKSSSNVSETESFHGSRSGMMSAPSTGIRGEEKSMSFVEASLVRTSPLLEKAQGSQVRDLASGKNLPGSLAKFDPVSSLWRTHQLSLQGDWEPFSGIFPRWGSMRNGECLERTTLAPLTNETGSGFWPTPCLPGNGGSNGKAKLKAMLWPTPCAMEPEKDLENFQNKRSLPRAQRGGGQGPNLATAVKIWPTPRSSDGDRTGTAPKPEWNRDLISNRLRDLVQLYPTPTVQDAKNNGAPSQMERHTKPLNAVVGGSLNPDWVEWLMGWAIGWTDLKPLAMDRFRQWLHSHGEF